MKKSLVIILFLTLIFTSFISTINAITIANDSLAKNISKLNSALVNSNPGYLTKIVDNAGNVPSYEYYPNHIASRSIKALKAFDGKIFMGLGDWNDNTGPAKVIYYDTADGKLKTSGTINDEAIQIFNIIDDKIYTTGCDPRDSWGYGSYYIYNEETNTWDKHMKNDGWIHVFNIVEFKDKLYMCGSTVDTMEESTIQVSADNGETFESIPVYKNNKVLPFDSSLRCYNLVVLNNKLYGYFYSSPYAGIYEYDENNNRFDYISDLPNVLLDYSDNNIFYNKLYLEYNIFNNTFIYPYSTTLYSSKDLKTFTSLKTGMKEHIRTTIVANDTLYCLTYENISKNNTYTTRIYSTKDLSKFDLVYEFAAEALPFSLEYYDNSFYIGTGYYNSVPIVANKTNGTLYKLTLNNNKKSIGIDIANTLVKILNNNVEEYNINYSLSNEITAFTSTLTFNNTMSVEQLRKEYNKINDFALMFSAIAYEADVTYLDSAPYFNNAISKKLANLYTIASTGIEFAKSAFTEDLNIEDKLFSLKSTKIHETENEYKVKITLTINNSSDFTTLKSSTSSGRMGSSYAIRWI